MLEIDSGGSKRAADNSVIISHKYKFIFICNGKTGTTSMEAALLHLDESVDFNAGAKGLWTNKHMPPSVIRSMLPTEVWNSYFKFVFVRHPLDWFVSQYRHNFRMPKRYGWGANLVRPWSAPKNWRGYKRKLALAQKDVLDADVVDLVFEHLKQYRGLPLCESLYQKTYVDDLDGNQLVDFVGLFENLAVDVSEVQSRIGLEFDMPHLNATDRRSFGECLTPHAISRIRDLWAVDFDRFGY